MTTYPIDLHHPNPTSLVTGRTTLFFDLSIWIRLARRKTPEAATAADRLTALVTEGRLVCPVSWPVYSELLHHDFESALPIAQLMDVLSLGLAYPQDNELITTEIQHYVDALATDREPSPLTPHELYVPIAGILATNAGMTWPPEFPAPASEQERLTTEFAATIRSFTMTDLITMARSHLPKPDHGAPEYHRAWNERFTAAKGNRTVMRRIEEEYQMTNTLLPNLAKTTKTLSPPDRRRFHERLMALPTNKHGGVSTAILEHLPVLRTRTELMAITGFNPNRKGDLHDFYDIEVMIAPVAHADAFVAQDKWITHLLTRETDLLTRNNTEHLSNIHALVTHLNTMSGGLPAKPPE